MPTVHAKAVTRKKKPALYDYSFNGKNLETVDTEKDLGVWVTSDLTWDKQTSEQCAKTNKLLGFVRVPPKAYEVCRHGARCTKPLTAAILDTLLTPVSGPAKASGECPASSDKVHLEVPFSH